MNDFLGKEVYVGDTIFYSTTGRHAESRFCEVVAVRAKTISVRIIRSNRPQYGTPRNITVQNSFVKVES